jgi:uncharacterized damage-inducible protein DinB
MRRHILAALFTLVAVSSASAQGFNSEVHRDLAEVEQKMIDLAKAIPESAYGWRAGTGRSVTEVLLHVASDNYFIPIALGHPAPASTGITGSDFASVEAYEKQKLGKDATIAALQASFQHLHQGLGTTTTDANLNEQIKFFGQDWTRQRAVLLTITHLHEHLGQLIAYARSNNVTPPWSR